ncbi:hypothetical protein Taro_051757 [Colocasia esculenta]|uniref:Photosynthetic NDH subcomplex L 2 n=1 Tax=Colocasia esculenta TaxID=4460 RepID=A0A843XHN7_COLES|nr:hypothetical protein [Colocasia esculenta]
MGSFLKHMVICHSYTARQLNDHHRCRRHKQACLHDAAVRCSSPTSAGDGGEAASSRRWVVASTTFLATSALLSAAAAQKPPPAAAEAWGASSYIKEHYFQPEISPEDSAARIRQTAQGLRSMRPMLENMSWRYVLLYVRVKMAYLSTDLKNAMTTVPDGRRKAYVKTANEVVDNMTELDRYVRTPKVYESYLYYERTLKSLDELLAQLA